MDLDGDGASNLQEYLADTDPRNQTEVLRVTDIRSNGSGCEILWLPKLTRLYTVESTTDLSLGTWTPLATDLPANPSGLQTFTDGTVGPWRHYRLRARLP